MSDIQLIVGLGNPGPEYQNTRHNAGTWFVEALAKQFGCTLKLENKFFGYTGRITYAGQDIRLLIPTTYMNKSGQAVSALSSFYRIPPENMLVAFDELDLPPGIVKFKVGGSSSQNGIRDIVSKLGNFKDFLRLRIGIGHPGDKSRVTGHVLGKASKQDQEKIDAAIDEALRCTEILLKDDLKKAMNRLHSFKVE
ncbi:MULTISPECIES: aminoacyl-tRNA hydrolase [Alteromonadaceae]|uniref:aminoacyl-tRNA hydrolase n=1 Tax=Alteromonadaceae TaxID=72275 RepID=UPI001C091868|nr:MULTISPECIES: aminoacyl-tRNA hydrolase [Aliiglaciecola]MBU2880027.1 aminoacyl-tRNA hydrolase [Aliiglaciecola lipolytica]MDO6710975.1 aminoacyl-tRNA hydrolase [Aliiglaciecola sp. 2_MG-2023]MDO6752456.1 aminoacyl-tRNA hydrolase [Aliiglaciecola sp. 1_MG-2023]